VSRFRPHAVAVSASIGAIVVVTLGIYVLRSFVPVVSLGSLYTLAVLPIAIYYGLGYAIGVSLVSMLAFNFLFLEPVQTFALEDSRNWGALAVYLVTAVVVSELAARARRHAAEVVAAAMDRERLARDALETEALRRSDAIKTAVIQAVSHDLRTPLATIEAAVDGLEGGAVALREDDRLELLDTIRLELTRLTRLVENLLDLSRLQAGAAEPSPELWTADQLLGRSLDELPDSSRVRVVMPDDLPLVRADGVQVQRVLVNLIENALKFSAGSVRIELIAAQDELVFEVTDSGPGIPEPELQQIFEPFHRVGQGSRGSGLGLAIARGFALANDGRVWAESRVGEGASFGLALPAVALPAEMRA
jgi:two-component system sensor histidine kinase KdpD